MLNIQHAIVVPNEIKSSINRDLYQSWMLYYQRGHYVRNSSEHGDFTWADNIDNLLSFYKNKSCDYLIVTWFGIYSSDFWNMHTLVTNLIEKKITRWFAYTNDKLETIAIINLKEWRDSNYLPFHKFIKQKTLPVPNNICNFLIDTGAIENPTGWNQDLLSFMALPNLQTNVVPFLQKLVESRNTRHANDKDAGVFFLYNTESICTNKEYLSTIKDQIDTIIGPCSMFKAFILGERYIGNVKNYIHFDIFSRNVDWKKHITENWNGTLKGLFETLKYCTDRGDGDFSFWNGRDNIIEKQWKVLLDEFGSEESIKQHWLIYQKQNHQYVLANMLFDDHNIIDALNKINANGVYHAIGDIPGFRSNALQFGLQTITDITKGHIERVESTCKNLFVDIKIPASDLQKFNTSEQIKYELYNDYNEFNFNSYSG